VKIAILTTDSREHYKDYANPLPTFGTAPEALLQGLAQLPEVEVHVVSCLQQPVISPEKLADNIWYHALPVPKIGWMRTGYQGCIRAVRRKLREIQPDIVHGQGTERDCAISAVLSGFPNVLTIHGNMNAIAQLHQSRIGSFHWLAARVEDFTLPRTGGIICISEYVRKLVERYEVQTWTVPNAIQKMFFDLPKANTASLERPLLINVGVISERKRQQELLAVLASLREQKLQFDTIFVGTSDAASAYAKNFNARLESAKLKYGGFEHIQRLDDASFCGLMDKASAMIHFSNEESFGLTFAEAIARGLYLFASDVGAVRTIAKGVDQVQVFGLDQWSEMKAAVHQWLAAGEDKKPRPQNPPQEFIHSFHPSFVARRHLEIYREELGGKKR
jgi:glycosyltransferase involved in cell wall biosynthesis